MYKLAGMVVGRWVKGIWGQSSNAWKDVEQNEELLSRKAVNK